MGQRVGAAQERGHCRQHDGDEEQGFTDKSPARFVLKIIAADASKRGDSGPRAFAAITIQGNGLIVVIRYRKFCFNSWFHIFSFFKSSSVGMRFASPLDSKVFKHTAPIAKGVPRKKRK